MPTLGFGGAVADQITDALHPDVGGEDGERRGDEPGGTTIEVGHATRTTLLPQPPRQDYDGGDLDA